MICLVYSSNASHLLNVGELEEILEQSRRNNLRDGITGLLLYKSGQLMQLLEGEERAVQACYERICTDSRHQEMLTLLKKPSKVRLFAQWSMAFENLDEGVSEENSLEEGFSSFLNRPFNSQELGPLTHEALFLLLSFKKQAFSISDSASKKSTSEESNG